MKIGMVIHTAFPPDIRVEKETRALLEAGHEVHLLTFPLSGRPREEIVHGIRVRRVSPPGGPSGKLNTLLYYLTFRDGSMKRAISSWVAEEGLESIHVHNLRFLGTALAAARGMGLPVVADLHENYPASLQLVKRRGNLLGYLKRSYGRWSAYEGRSLRASSRVIVVVEEARDRVLCHGLPEEKVTVVSNTVDLETFISFPEDGSLAARFRGRRVLLYLGGLGEHRGIGCLLRAFQSLNRGCEDLCLVIVGEGRARGALERAAGTLGLGGKVKFLGWIPFEKTPTLIRLSEICLVPHERNPHTDATVPHKLFQYMALGKPVVVSDCVPLRRIVEEGRCGLVFRSGDPEDLSKCLGRLLSDGEERRRLGTRGRGAVEMKYNWGEDAKRLLRLYEDLAHSLTSRTWHKNR